VPHTSLSNHTRPMAHRHVPPELWALALSHLDTRSLVRMRLSTKRFKTLAEFVLRSRTLTVRSNLPPGPAPARWFRGGLAIAPSWSLGRVEEAFEGLGQLVALTLAGDSVEGGSIEFIARPSLPIGDS
jgi:hypothetical protein